MNRVPPVNHHGALPAEHMASREGEDFFSDSADEWEAPPAVQEDEKTSDAGTRRSTVPAHLEGIERELAGEKVGITFILPSGQRANHAFFMGQTVEYLKSYLDDQHQLHYGSTTLYLGDRMLLDPLSLNDLPFQVGENNDVRVVLADPQGSS